MKVLMTTIGSLGDVAPLAGLGRRLTDAGHEVALATHDRFEPLVRGTGLEFRSIPTDALTAFDPPADDDPSDGDVADPCAAPEGLGRRARAKVAEIRAGLDFVASNVRSTGEDLLRVASPDDEVLIASATTAPFAGHIAEGLGIPSMGAYVEAAYATGDFAPFLGRSLGRHLNRAAGQAVFAVFDAAIASTTRQLRRELGLGPLSPRGLRNRQAAEGWPVCCGFSPELVPRPADWPSGMEVVGFWWPEPAPGWEPSPELEEFLAAGPPPVFVGFGSARLPDGDAVSDVVGTALRQVGARAIAQRGPTGLAVEGDHVLGVDEVRFDWLFPQLAAVVHAGGAGTTAAGLRAGVPAVTIPTMTDQMFWSTRLARVGAAPDPIPLRRLRADRLAAALEATLHRPHHREAAQRLAPRIAAEDGAGAVVRRLDQLAAGTRPPVTAAHTSTL